ncbi:MAG: sugar ABC transporter permease [Firmicutes bacterium]|nr:sugar ABC transporter permease [Bacillota bacterium]
MRKNVQKTFRIWLGKDWLSALGFLSPALVLLGLFVYHPLIQSFLYSFTRWDMVQEPQWVGTTNYQILMQDPRFWTSVRQTFLFTFGTVIPCVILSLFFAILISGKIRGAKLYQSIYFLPVVTSLVIVATIWLYVLQPEYGPLNYLLSFLGIKGPLWLRSSSTAMSSIIGMTIWRDFGYCLTLFLAGLTNIPSMFYEAASIDGASAWQRFRHITLPLLAPTTLFIFIVSVIRSFQVFTQIHVLTQGGPMDSTLVLVYYIWQQAFRYYRAGYSSAAAVIFFVMIVVLSILQMRISERRIHY